MELIFITLFWISVFLIVYSYALYPVLLIILSKCTRVVPPADMEELPGVSIVIAAYNEEKTIRKRIENCLELDYPADKLEVIIASDGSDDGTNGIIREYEARGVVLHGYSGRRGKVNVLNESVPQAKHGIIVFSDANTFFEPDAVKKLVRHFQDKKMGSVCGLLRFVNAEGSKVANLEGVYWRFETMMKKREGARGSLLGANGAIFAIRKELFFHCPPNTIVEDFVMPMKILEQGYKVVYDPEAVAIEETAKHIIQEKQRRIRIGAGDFQALTMLWHMLDPRKGFPALAFLSHKVLRWLAPFFMIIAFLANLPLLDIPLYKALFILQCIFYGCAVIGQILSWTEIQIKVFSLCYYFVSMNLALFLGFVRFVTSRQAVTWERTER